MLAPSKLERYYEQFGFSIRYMLSASDVESLSQARLLEMARPETLPLWENLSLGYTESQGHPLLREEIAGLYDTIYPEQVVVAAPEEANFIAMQTLLKPGDHVISLFPAYQSLFEVARTIGCGVSFWNLRACPEGWELPLEELVRLIRPETRLLVLNFPHNPTGYQPTREKLDAILEIARRFNLVVFSDEMYRFLEYTPASRLPSVADLYENGISLSGLSKAFALPGLRVGWLATQTIGLPAQWMEYKDYTTICASAPSEILALIALQARDSILARSRQIILGNLAAAEDFFARHDDHLVWLPPDAGPLAFPLWHGPPSVERFCQDMLDQQNVLVLPNSIFNVSGPHFRLGLGRKNFPQALDVLDLYLASIRQEPASVFHMRHPLNSTRSRVFSPNPPYQE
jgi:aspartate/methionine/tyrosine aminotransferase